MKRYFKHFFIAILIFGIIISCCLQLLEEKKKSMSKETNEEVETDYTIKLIEIEEDGEEDIYQEKLVMKREDFMLLQVKNQSESVTFYDEDIYGKCGKVTLTIESTEVNEDGICKMIVKINSALKENMIFSYEDRLKLFYLDNNLQIPANEKIEDVSAFCEINKESSINYVKLTMDGGYELTNEKRALCELVPGDNYFIINFDIGKKAKDNEYCWYLSSLSIPNVSQKMEQFFNMDYAIKIELN